MSGKARRLRVSCISPPMAPQGFGLGYEVFVRVYRELLQSVALLYGGFEPRR
jgi:hypothetical protein